MMNEKQLLQLITDLIAFKTVYKNDQAFADCIAYIKAFYAKTPVYIKEYAWNGSTSLVIANQDTTNFDIIFCGHLDVVPAPDSLFTIKKDGDLIYGRGVADMKGQVAIMMQLMRHIAQGTIHKKIALFLTSDEERGGFDGVNKLLNNQGYMSKVAIVPDGGFNFSLVIEAKGVLQLKITTHGTGCHSSEPWNGSNAIAKLLKIYDHLIAKFPLPTDPIAWKTSCNLACIEGGDSLNKVPNAASMCIDIRHIYDDKSEDFITHLKAFDSTLDIKILAQGNAFKINPILESIKEYCDICEQNIGRKVEHIKYPAASDGRFFTEKNIPCIIMNPIGGDIHCDNEWVSLNSLCLLEKIYEQYVVSL